LAIDRYKANLVKSKRIDSRAGRLATERITDLTNLYLSSLVGITEFKIRSRCKDMFTCFRITINVKPEALTQLRIVPYLFYEKLGV